MGYLGAFLRASAIEGDQKLEKISHTCIRNTKPITSIHSGSYPRLKLYFVYQAYRSGL